MDKSIKKKYKTKKIILLQTKDMEDYIDEYKKSNNPHWEIQKEKYKYIKSTKILTGSNPSTPLGNTKKEKYITNT